MTRNEGHFDEFQPHTRLKHAILDTYIVAWAMKLFMWGGAGDRLAIVDAFAGAGRDAAGNEGSPLIAARRARQAMAEAEVRRPLTDPKVHVFAIEKDPGRFRTLTRNLAPYTNETPELIRALEGELVDHIDSIHAEIGECPTFYFLDPFGIKGLDASTYPKMLSRRHKEVFALFADIGAVRLHGQITAERADAVPAVERILAAPSLFPEYDAADIEVAKQDATRANEALDASIPASRGHLSRALGDQPWPQELEATRGADRADTFLRLFANALSAAGGRHVLTIPMRNDSGQRVYALVHASQSTAGHVAMKEAVSTGIKHADLGDAARMAMIADLSVDLVSLVNRLRTQLAGHSVLWADQHHGLKALLLAHTPLFHFQMDELKAALKQAGILQRVNRKEVCVFPPVSPPLV